VLLSRVKNNASSHAQFESEYFSLKGKQEMFNLFKAGDARFFLHNVGAINTTDVDGTIRQWPVILEELDKSRHPQLLSPADLNRTNIRTASFHVMLNSATAVKEDKIKIFLIDTIPIRSFFTVNFRDLYARNPHRYNGLYHAYLSKIISHLKTIEVIDNHGNPSMITQFTVNFDVYYDRTLDKSGLFHSDTDVGNANRPIYVSLEIFAPDGVTLLGTEVLFCEQFHQTDLGSLKIGNTKASDEIIYNKVSQEGLRSYRVLVDNKSTVLFNNARAIHATPIIGIPIPGQNGTVPFNVLERQQEIRRLEADAPGSAIITDTKILPRSFIRTYISPVDATVHVQEIYNPLAVPYNVIEHYIQVEDQSEIDRLRNEDFHGGSVNVYNNATSNISKYTAPQIIGKYATKQIVNTQNNDLISFTIRGNPYKTQIAFTNNVMFEEIAPSHVNEFITKENNEINELKQKIAMMNKKGGNKKMRRNITKKRKNKKTMKKRKMKKSAKKP